MFSQFPALPDRITNLAHVAYWLSQQIEPCRNDKKTDILIKWNVPILRIFLIISRAYDIEYALVVGNK